MYWEKTFAVHILKKDANSEYTNNSYNNKNQFNQSFQIREDTHTQITKKHMKRCSTSLIVKKIQN